MDQAKEKFDDIMDAAKNDAEDLEKEAEDLIDSAEKMEKEAADDLEEAQKDLEKAEQEETEAAEMKEKEKKKEEIQEEMREKIEQMAEEELENLDSVDLLDASSEDDGEVDEIAVLLDECSGDLGDNPSGEEIRSAIHACIHAAMNHKQGGQKEETAILAQVREIGDSELEKLLKEIEDEKDTLFESASEESLSESGSDNEEDVEIDQSDSELSDGEQSEIEDHRDEPSEDEHEEATEDALDIAASIMNFVEEEEQEQLEFDDDRILVDDLGSGVAFSLHDLE